MAHRTEASLENTILRLLDERGEGKTICPSEVARVVAPDDWRPLMQPVRDAAARLVSKNEIVVTQRGKTIDLASAKGPIRLRKS